MVGEVDMVAAGEDMAAASTLVLDMEATAAIADTEADGLSETLAICGANIN